MNTSRRLVAIRKVFRILGCLLALWIGVATPGLGGVNRWTSGGPAGVGVNCLAIDPRNPQAVYAGTGQNGVFKSANGGLSWSNSGGIQTLSVWSLAIDPLTPSTVYAATNSGVFKSTDAGSGWDAVRPGLPSPSLSFGVLAINPVASSTVYAGTDNGLFKSTDGGLNWNLSNYFVASWIYSLVFDPQKPSTIYAADYGYPDFDYANSQSRVYTSKNDGATWSLTGASVVPAIFGALVIDPAQSSILYAGTRKGLYKSVDAGATWSLPSADLENVAVSALAIDPKNPGTLYAANYGRGVLRSTDGGISWAPFNSGLTNTNVGALAIDRTGTRLHAGTTKGVFDYQIFSGALDLTVGTDNTARLAFVDIEGSVVLRSIDSAGASTSSASYGPYSGWSTTAVADGADGLTRLLWNNLDGSAALWLVSPQGNQAPFRFGPMAGWSAVDVAASIAGQTHLLWRDEVGRIVLWSVDNSGQVSTGPTYGPYPGWTAIAATDGPDGRTRVLWNHLDGRAAISLAQSGNLLASYSYGPVAGWTALDVAVGGDGLTRILWSHRDRRIALWVVNSAGQVTTYGGIYPAPADMNARRIAAGPDGSSRVLFTNYGLSAILWQMSADGIFESSIVASAVARAIDMTGFWTGTFGSADLVDCDTNTPAKASFEQNSSTFVGALDSSQSSCGFSNG